MTSAVPVTTQGSDDGEPQPLPLEPPDPVAAGRRRFHRAGALGALLALLPFTWLLCQGRADLTQTHPLAGFYDAQAHAFLDLRWDVPAEALSVEAFTVDGRSYMYFGPTPALLRLPVAAVTDTFDGRLTQPSMLAALVVALAATTRLSWRVRTLVRGDVAVGRRDLAAAAATTFLVGAGSSLLFLASGLLVYHEALLWGVALSLAAYDVLLRWTAAPTRRLLLVFTVLASLAVLARASVGLGPAIAMGFVFLSRAVTTWRDGGAGAVARRWRALSILAVVAVTPLALQAATNHAKFKTLFSIPFESQLVSQIQPGRMAFLERTGGTLFGLEYAPTTVLHYVRPDAVGFQRQLPWVTFPGDPTVIGGVPFDLLDRSSSLPVSMPWLVALAVVGLVAMARGRSDGTRRARAALWAPLVGSLSATGATAAIAYIANRYLSDALPFLLLAGLVGLHRMLALPRRRVAAAGAGLAVLGVAAVTVNLAHGLLFQRSFGPPAHEETRAELVAWQRDADRLLPGDQAPRVRPERIDGPLPDDGIDGELVVVGDCDGLYQHDGEQWRPVERTAAVGRTVHDVVLDDGIAAGTRRVVLAAGRDAARRTLSVEPRGNEVGVLVLEVDGRSWVSDEIGLGAGARRLDVRLDRRLATAEVVLDGEDVLWGLGYQAVDDAPLTPVTDPAVTSASPVPVAPELCRSLRPVDDAATVG